MRPTESADGSAAQGQHSLKSGSEWCSSPSPGSSRIRPAAAAVKALRCAPTAHAARTGRAALTAVLAGQNRPIIRAKGKNGQFFTNVLDRAATWKSILCRSKHKRSTRINRAGIAMPSAINPKHLVATNFNGLQQIV